MTMQSIQAGRLKEHFERAKTILEAIIQDPALTKEGLYGRLKDYILCRFLLEPDECEDDDLEHLSETSIMKVRKLRASGTDIQDVSPGCTSVSSVTAKKVLLLVSLQKGLGIDIEPAEAAEIKTTEQLTDALYRELKNRS